MGDKFAIITGASTRSGSELAHLADGDGYDRLVDPDQPLIESAGAGFRQHGVKARAMEVDLATIERGDQLLSLSEVRSVEIVLANGKADATRIVRDDWGHDDWDTMFDGKAHIVAGSMNKVQAAVAHSAPASLLVEQHRKMAEPGSGNA